MNKVGSRDVTLGLITIGLLAVVLAVQVRAEEGYHVAAVLVAPEPGSDATFGASVAIGGDIVVVGEPKARVGGTAVAGRAHVFDTEGNLLLTLHAPEPAYGDCFGISVAVGGSIVAVGARGVEVGGQEEAGKVYLFDVGGNLLTVLQAPELPVSRSLFGCSVAVSGGTLVVGEMYATERLNRAGRAYGFDFDGNLLFEMRSPDPIPESHFGYSVASSDGIILIGEPWAEDSDGRTHMYDSEGNLVLTLRSPEPESAKFGKFVHTNGETILVGEPNAPVDESAEAGRVHIFNPEGNMLLTIHAPEPEENAFFGSSLATSGDRIIVGEPNADVVGVNEGKVYVFDSDGSLLTALTAPEPAGGAVFGTAVAASDDLIVVGESDAVVDDQFKAGRVYIFNKGEGVEAEPESGSEPEPETAEVQPAAEKQTGIPGFPYESTILGTVIAASILMMLQRRTGG